jgi:hypothetical protein
MQHLLSFFFAFAIGEILLGFTPQGDPFGAFRWPVFYTTAIMACVGAWGFYKTEKARYFALPFLACMPFLPIGFLPAYFFWKWVDWLSLCDDRIRVKVMREMKERSVL